MIEEATIALNKAKVHLMSRADSAFFTTICFSLKHEFTEKIPTAATNGKEIFFNPYFFMKLTRDEQIFLLLHESMHVAYLHMERVQTRNKRIWNIAADHVINLMLIERGYKMPEGGYADPQYTGMSSEEVYALLLQDPNAGNQEVMEDLLESDTDTETLQRDIDDILVRAKIQSEQRKDKPGTIPGDIQIRLKKLLEPKLPYHLILRKYINSLAKFDYSFKKFNRRFFPDYFLPGLHSEKLMDIAACVDASASVRDEEFLQYVSDLDSILRFLKPETMHLVQFDSNLKSIDKIQSPQELRSVNFTGRGGTRIQPVLDWISSAKPKLVLVFSDGYFTQPPYTPPLGTRIIWLIHNNPRFKTEYGKVIHFEI